MKNSYRLFLVSLSAVLVAGCERRVITGGADKVRNLTLCEIVAGSDRATEGDVVSWGGVESIVLPDQETIWDAAPVHLSNVTSHRGVALNPPRFWAISGVDAEGNSGNGNLADAHGIFFTRREGDYDILMLDSFFRLGDDGKYRNTGAFRDGISREQMLAGIVEYGAFAIEACPPPPEFPWEPMHDAGWGPKYPDGGNAPNP